MRLMFVVVMGLAVGACATTEIPGADAVVLTSNHELARGCRFIGQEVTTLHTQPAFLAMDSVKEGTRRGAALKGGDLVVSDGPVVVHGEGVGRHPMVTMTGDVYDCSAVKPRAAS